MFKTGCCGCCGSAWDFAQNFGEHAIFLRNPLFQLGVQPPVEGFYDNTGTAVIVDYTAMSGIGDAPYRQFGACSNGNILIYDDNHDIYEVEPYSPFRSLGVKWDSTTDVASVISSGGYFAWYHSDPNWEYGTLDCRNGAFDTFRKGFDVNGDFITPTVPSGQTLNNTVCMDKDGNIYYITRKTSDFSWRIFRSGTEIYYHASLSPGKLVHTDDNLYAAGDDGLYLISGGSRTRVYTSETELATETDILPYCYSEVLKRMYCGFGHKTPGAFGVYREVPHRINFRAGEPDDDYMFFGSQATGFLVEWA